MENLLVDNHFWVGVAFLILVAVLVSAGVHKLVWKVLGDTGAKVQAQLDEAEALRKEAQTLLAQITDQRAEAERQATAMIEAAKAEATRMQAEAKANLAEQIARRGQLAERRIAVAEAQATADVKAAAADLASQMAETVLAGRISGAKSDPLIDAALDQLATRAFSPAR